MYVTTKVVNQEQLAEIVNAAIGRLNPEEVKHVAYSVGYDSTDDPALFFRIVLADEASREECLGDVTERVKLQLSGAVRPLENWGLFPYYSFRSFSEQRMRSDPEWS